MIQINVTIAICSHKERMWEKIATVPSDRDVELAVIGADGTHALVFPCRKTRDGWVNSETGRRIDVHPTHWRDWRDDAD